jgi:hypothetical protein
VERAAKKLRVDHLIMQKNNYRPDKAADKKLKNDEMLQMVKYGMQEIISTANQETITEQDIEKIIAHSMKKTDVINAALDKIKLENKFNLNNISLTGEENQEKKNQSDLYTWQGQNYRNTQASGAVQQQFINLPPRAQKPIMGVNQTFKMMMKGEDHAGETSTQNRKKRTGWRLAANGGYDHQFFNSAELDRLEAKENAWKEYCKRCEEDPKAAEDLAAPEPFSFIDSQSMQTLLSEGWANWNNNDFNSFI